MRRVVDRSVGVIHIRHPFSTIRITQHEGGKPFLHTGNTGGRR